MGTLRWGQVCLGKFKGSFGEVRDDAMIDLPNDHDQNQQNDHDRNQNDRSIKTKTIDQNDHD